MRALHLLFITILCCSLANCQDPDMQMDNSVEDEQMEQDMEMNAVNTNKEVQAVIAAVEVSGSENSYTFNVTIASPDTGCKQYADWWEVFDQDGNLIYRRILGHSHVDEQPFTRSGGPVVVDQKTIVTIRAHMNNLGYGSYTFSGSVAKGFSEELVGPSLFSTLEETAPLPKNCAF